MANKLKKNDLTSLFPNLVEVLDAYGKTLVERYREGLIDGDHIATGNLFNSVSSEVTLNGQSFIVEFRMPEYGEYLEQGTKPHFPPLNAIENWIRVKRIVPRQDMQGKLPTERQLAFLIARKISEEGTPATHLWEKANALTFNEWNKLIDEAINMDLNENLEEILQTLNQKTKVKRRKR